VSGVYQTIKEWAGSHVKSKAAAARLARQLAKKEPGTLVASKENVASDLGVHQSTAQRARMLLIGAGVVFKSGRHLYVSDKAIELRERAS
jgi:DNA-binding transcriptional regulator YhcF (GntR family)